MSDIRVRIFTGTLEEIESGVNAFLEQLPPRNAVTLAPVQRIDGERFVKELLVQPQAAPVVAPAPNGRGLRIPN